MPQATNIPSLVALLKEGLEDRKAAAALELGRLVGLGEEICVQIVTAGALPPLVKLLKEGSESGQRTASNASAAAGRAAPGGVKCG